ncbi:ABC transporter ATP-binding protein [Leeuwenhoekiella marinoflava]|uniref:Lipopolysaccharide transport system ATP-binding protein n=2 Tax=Leeuwenhoekiella marinoflava TaxID=988 RepID=A0A4Q0PIN4_9FLAO|nr:ABC transporter ATP-binding protein [Leeuwenhoekiella marinoflava]RXG26910.1 lipopolysaccharide transport system ATP-binding protein [Leeuwenhoekiella marinoflava]SHF40910.1 lipopolysaccharide transport system ATP-binding protein [Leeuwenhoekiella marinoflava DSM 3653]
MSDIILKAENISKQYRLGTVGSGTLRDDFKRSWAKLRGKEDPFLKVGAVNDRSQKSTEDYVWALCDINFEVKQGEVLGIIGKNGAGKSTLLKILSRVTAPTTGVIKSRGRIASLLEVGTGFHHELTGRENIYLNGAILGMTKAEINSKLDEIIDFSGCERYIDTPTKRYSSGMTVRLAFAVAAHLEPEILVVDEVLAVGDAEFQKKAIGKMQDISQGEGRTVLFVSHNMASVKSLCTRGILLEQGNIKLEGETDTIVNDYLNLSSAEFDLKQRTERSGNGKIKINNAQFLNRSNKVVQVISSGDYLKMRVSFDVNEEDFEHLIFGFSISDVHGNLKAMTVTDEMALNINHLINRGYIDVEFSRLPLRGGSYNIQLVLSENNTSVKNHLDVIDNALNLKVLEGDFFRTGKINRRYNALVLDCNIV